MEVMEPVVQPPMSYANKNLGRSKATRLLVVMHRPCRRLFTQFLRTPATVCILPERKDDFR